ncbi:MAG: glycosyltransferase [Vicinamibacterales bacterium]
MTLVFYCQHSLGIGHFVRARTLAEQLATRFRVVFVNGGLPPEGLRFPESVTRIDLPPLGMTAEGRLVSYVPGREADSLFSERRATLVSLVARERPAVVLVELFPFGRRKFAREIEPMLEAARGLDPRPLVVSSVRDVLVTGRDDQQGFDDRANATLERLFDGVLVHADPRFADFGESFRPSRRLGVPLHYTGFVTRSGIRPDAPETTEESVAAGSAATAGVVVSAGGGMVGMTLFEAALDAQTELWRADGLSMTILAGPLLPDAAWQTLQARAAGRPGLTLLRRVDDLAALLSRARVSVSQCGYNTAMDVLAARVPALVVPFGGPQEDEQRRRAARLEGLGVVRVLPPADATPQALASEIRRLLGAQPAPAVLDTDGAVRSTELLAAMVEDARHPSGDRDDGPVPSREVDWIGRVRATLDARAHALTVFLRDDDAGWADGKLERLLTLCHSAGCPLDLAVIPECLTDVRAAWLLEARARATARLGLHQHGWAHVNHEAHGRSSEFGDGRSLEAVARDIDLGRARLTSLLGAAADPIFTPPWNRCRIDIAPTLAASGLTLLSRDRSAPPLPVGSPVSECPVSFDWFAKRRGLPLGEAAWTDALCAGLAQSEPFGLLLHHAVMGDADFARLGQLVALLTAHPRVHCRSLLDAAAEWPADRRVIPDDTRVLAGVMAPGVRR